METFSFHRTQSTHRTHFDTAKCRLLMLCYVCTPVEMKRNAQVVSYMFLAGEDDEAARTAALPRRRISLQSPGIFRGTAATADGRDATELAKTNKNEGGGKTA